MRTLQKLDNECFNGTENNFYVCLQNNSWPLTYNNLTRRLPSSFEAKKEIDVTNLLDYVNLNLYVLTCNNQSCNQSQTSVFKCLQLTFTSSNNSTCLLTNDPCSLLSFVLQYGKPKNWDKLKPEIQPWFLVFVLGLMCLFGNSIVIFRQIFNLPNQRNYHKESRIYNSLLLSLSLADFLMGIYLVIISFEIKRKSYDPHIYYTEYRLCNALGVLNLISSQVSTSTILLVSCFRLYSVVRPFKKVKLRIAFYLIALTWILWILVAVLPIIDIEPFETFFNIGITFNQQVLKKTDLNFADYRNLFETIKGQLRNDSFLKFIFDAISNDSSNTVIEKAMKSFNLINYQNKTWSPLGFYNKQFYCTSSMIVGNSYVKSKYFTLFFLLFNLISSFVVIVAYIAIYLSINDCQSKILYFLSKRNDPNQDSVNRSQQKKAENLTVLCTITIIVLTDALFWFVICIASLSKWDLYDLTKEESFDWYINDQQAFQSVMFYLVSLNSVINPFVYFNRFWYSVIKKLKT